MNSFRFEAIETYHTQGMKLAPLASMSKPPLSIALPIAYERK